MQMVALLAIQLSRGPHPPALEALPAAATLPTAGHAFLVGGVTFVAQLLVMAQQPAVDNQRLPGLGHDRGWVDLAQIDPGGLPSRQQRRLGRLFDRERQLIVVGPPEQFYFADADVLE